MIKLVFDKNNNRVVTESDDQVFYTDDFETTNKVIETVVNMFNEGKSLTDIDEYLLDESECTQDDREIIIEALFLITKFA